MYLMLNKLLCNCALANNMVGAESFIIISNLAAPYMIDPKLLNRYKVTNLLRTFSYQTWWHLYCYESSALFFLLFFFCYWWIVSLNETKNMIQSFLINCYLLVVDFINLRLRKLLSWRNHIYITNMCVVFIYRLLTLGR